MPTPPLDLVEFEGRPPFADFKPVSMDDYIKSFRKRWCFRTSIGDVILKKLGQLDRDRILVEFYDAHPELVEVLKEVDRLREFHRRGIPLDAEHQMKMESCAKQISAQARLFSMACFEIPKFEDLEEYDAFLTALDSDEVTKLYILLSELTSARSATASCEVLLTIAKEYGIPISKDLTLENMTAEQADILVNTLEKKGELMKREMGKIAE